MVASQMLDLGRQMEMELQSGVLGTCAPTASSSALVLANIGGGGGGRRDGGRPETIGAPGTRGDSTRIAPSNQHPGVLTDSEEPGVKTRDGGKVRKIID